MKENNLQSQVSLDSLKKELQVIAQKVRDLSSPMGSIRYYLEDMIEESTQDDWKNRLIAVNNVNDRCINILRELVEITLPYF